MKRYAFQTHPSLALVKYWGKRSVRRNVPATSSMAVALNDCTTTVTIVKNDLARDYMLCDRVPTPADVFNNNYAIFLKYCRAAFNTQDCWDITIDNNYPLAAGLASSSAIYAGLVLALNAAYGSPFGASRLSAMARRGSASAARSIFGGFVALPAGRSCAFRYVDANYWPGLRIIVAQCASEQKPISSRAAMVHTKQTGTLFPYWQRYSRRWYRHARRAIAQRDIKMLGVAMQQSYLAMFATMHSARPPIFYWNEQSVGVIKCCQRLRADKMVAWETMDAGPQVKILTTDTDAERICAQLRASVPAAQYIISRIGASPHALSINDDS